MSFRGHSEKDSEPNNNGGLEHLLHSDRKHGSTEKAVNLHADTFHFGQRALAADSKEFKELTPHSREGQPAGRSVPQG